MKKCTIVFVMLCLPFVLKAGGFQVSDHNARAVAMGFAVVSDPGSAGTIFFNPAGLIFLPEGFQVSIGSSLLLPSAKFTGPTNLNKFETTDMDSWAFVLPHLYIAYRTGNLAFGVGLFVPFGTGTKWDPSWAGRNLNVRTYLQNVTINPVIAYGLLDNKLSLSAGATITLGEAELRQRVPQFDPEPMLNLTGSGTAVSWNVGVLYEINKDLRVGLSYRHNINMEYKGNAKFSLDPEGNTPLTGGLQYLFADGGGGTALNLPFDARFGVSYRVSENLLVELGADLVGWSSFDTLKINFDKMPGAPRKRDGSDSAGTVLNPRNYQTTPVFRIGAEYTASESLKLRFGTYFDPVPVDAQYTQPVLPDANRLGFSAGFGLKLSNSVSLDAGYLFVYGLQREVKNSSFRFDGLYNAWAHVLSVSCTIAF